MNSHHDFLVSIPATYCSQWQDGFGARGWKLDVSIGDPAVIASTAEAGAQIPTSVFVHDILDHHLCGLAMSGHRNEAIALNLLSERTGSSPVPDYQQMIEEDILRGDVNGEPMQTFLNKELMDLVPAQSRTDDKSIVRFLINKLGIIPLKAALTDHFVYLGKQGYGLARLNWSATGLDFESRKSIGLCIQHLLEMADPWLENLAPEEVHASIKLSGQQCALVLEESGDRFSAQVRHC